MNLWSSLGMIHTIPNTSRESLFSAPIRHRLDSLIYLPSSYTRRYNLFLLLDDTSRIQEEEMKTVFIERRIVPRNYCSIGITKTWESHCFYIYIANVVRRRYDVKGTTTTGALMMIKPKGKH